MEEATTAGRAKSQVVLKSMPNFQTKHGCLVQKPIVMLLHRGTLLAPSNTEPSSTRIISIGPGAATGGCCLSAVT